MAKHNHKNNNKKASSALKEESITRYSGPIKPKITSLQLTSVKRFACTSSTAITNVGGLMQNTFNSSPTGLPDWSSLQSTWSQWRMLAMELTFVPAFENSYPTATAAGGCLAMVIDRNNGGTALSFADALSFEGCTYGSINKRHSISTKATGPDEMSWVDISTSAFQWTIRTSSTAMSISTPYGVFIVSYLIELRSQA